MTVETFDTPGAHTFTVPANVWLLEKVECIPGGAGGGRGGGAANGGGGGGAAYANKLNIPVTPGQQIPLVVGTGQAGATAGTPQPTAATNSTFNTNVVVADAGDKGVNGALANAGDRGAAGTAAASTGDNTASGTGGQANTITGGPGADTSGIPSATISPGAPGGVPGSGLPGVPGTAPGGAGSGGDGSGNQDGGAGATGVVKITYTAGVGAPSGAFLGLL